MTRRNIFVVDIESVREILKEANAAVAQRSRDLISAFQRMPATLASEDEMRRALMFSGQLKEQMKECRAARLSDEKSFKDAVKAVEDYFSDIEKPLKPALESVVRRIACYEAERRPDRATEAHPVPVMKSDEGLTIAVGAAAPASAGESPIVTLNWAVASIDRQALDLESLRPYLTDAALRQAATRHLIAHGPHQLRGVGYEQVAAI